MRPLGMDIGALVTHLGKLRSDFLGGDDLNIPQLIFIPSCGLYLPMFAIYDIWQSSLNSSIYLEDHPT